MDPLRHVPLAQKFALARRLRRAPPPAERHAWSLLRNRGVLGLKFRRQHVLHGFIVDFYCVAERLVLELESDAHDGGDRQTYDAARAKVLQAAGYRVMRVRNRDVTRQHLEALLRQALRRSPIVPPLPQGEGDRGEDGGRAGPGGDPPLLGALFLLGNYLVSESKEFALDVGLMLKGIPAYNL